MQNAITYFSLMAVIVFIAACVLNARYILMIPKRIPEGAGWVAIIWLVMLFGMGQWFDRSESVTTLTSVDSSAILQVGSICVALFFALLVAGRTFRVKNIKLPFMLIGVYAVIGLILSPIAPFPAMSAFKSTSLIASSLLAVIAIHVLSKTKAPLVIYNTVFAYFSVLVILALVGGAFFPELTLKESGGVFGYMLAGWPSLNPNSLSYVSAVVLVVAVHRLFLEPKLYRRTLYLALVFASAVALVLAQGRTSIGGAFIAILFLAFSVREMRSMRYAIGVASVMMVSLLLLTGTVGEWVGEVEEYLIRGASDEQISTLSGRTEAWQVSWDLFKMSPLVGYGFYAAGKVLLAPHNAYFTVLINVGLIGFLPWLLGLIAGFARIVSQSGAWFVRTNPVERKYHKEVMAVMIVQILRTITGQDLSIHSYSMLLFFSVLVYLYAWEIIGKGVDTSIAMNNADNNYKPHNGDSRLQILRRVPSSKP